MCQKYFSETIIQCIYKYCNFFDVVLWEKGVFNAIEKRQKLAKRCYFTLDISCRLKLVQIDQIAHLEIFLHLSKQTFCGMIGTSKAKGANVRFNFCSLLPTRRKMFGWLVVNSFMKKDKFLDLYNLLMTSASEREIQLELVTTTDLLCPVGAAFLHWRELC